MIWVTYLAVIGAAAAIGMVLLAAADRLRQRRRMRQWAVPFGDGGRCYCADCTAIRRATAPAQHEEEGPQ